MSEKRHTPGPWNVSPVVNHDGPGTCQGITDSEGVVVARLDVWADSCAPEADANAAIIAAAPELLESLTASQSWLSKFIADQGEHGDAGLITRCHRQFERNAAAIAKAVPSCVN